MTVPNTVADSCAKHACSDLRASPAFFRMRGVVRITALSRPTLYRRIAARRFRHRYISGVVPAVGQRLQYTPGLAIRTDIGFIKT